MRKSTKLILLTSLVFVFGMNILFSQEPKYFVREIPNVKVSISPANPTTKDRINFTVTAYGNRGPGIERIVIAVNGRKVKVCSMSPCVYRGGPYREGLLRYEVTVYDKGLGLYSSNVPWTSSRKVVVKKPVSLRNGKEGLSGRVIHLIPLAKNKNTQWLNGTIALPFPGEDGDYSGFADYRYDSFLEDGRVYPKVLLTYPEWRNEYGLIVGIFKIENLAQNAIFRAKVGFLEDAIQSDGVEFRAFVNGEPSFYSARQCNFDGHLDDLILNLDRYAGQDVEIALQVRALRTSLQDWAVWVDPRIEW
jgi:hypothetical protein